MVISGEWRGTPRRTLSAAHRNALISLVSPVGFEPTAPRLKVSRSVVVLQPWNRWLLEIDGAGEGIRILDHSLGKVALRRPALGDDDLASGILEMAPAASDEFDPFPTCARTILHVSARRRQIRSRHRAALALLVALSSYGRCSLSDQDVRPAPGKQERRDCTIPAREPQWNPGTDSGDPNSSTRR
jgi:hypothetical protein